MGRRFNLGVTGIEMRHTVPWVHGTPILMSTAIESCSHSDGVGHKQVARVRGKTAPSPQTTPDPERTEGTPSKSCVGERFREANK